MYQDGVFPEIGSDLFESSSEFVKESGVGVLIVRPLDQGVEDFSAGEGGGDDGDLVVGLFPH